jgi:hypothetical protein
MLKKTLILVFILTPILCSEAFSEENQIDEGTFSRIFRGLSISPGISIKSPVIRIKRRSDGQQADMTDSPGVLSFDIDISSRDFDFPNSNFGVSLFLHSSYFKASEQFAGINGEEVKKQDLGTSLSGYYSYLIPALYYKHHIDEVEGKFGVGLGYGSARFSGSALFGPERMVSRAQPKSTLSTSANDVLAYMVFYDLEWPNSLRLRVSVGGPQFSDSEYKYSLEEFTLTLSYTFSIL